MYEQRVYNRQVSPAQLSWKYILALIVFLILVLLATRTPFSQVTESTVNSGQDVTISKESEGRQGPDDAARLTGESPLAETLPSPNPDKLTKVDYKPMLRERLGGDRLPDDADETPANPYDGNFMFGDWGSFRSKMAEKGVNVEFSFTQFGQILSWTKPDTFDYYANRFDLMVNVDTAKAGLWKGGGIGTHVETRFGGASAGIALYPANAALITLTTGDARVVVSSLYLTQKLRKTSSIMFGKINTLDLLAAARFMGGRGIDGFMHIAFAGPPSGVAPVSTYGALFSTRFKEKYGFSFYVFDPQDQTGWHEPFQKGVNFSPSFVIPGKTFGHNATHTIAATFSTMEGTDLDDVPQVILPPGLQRIGTRRGSFNINYTYEQYFFRNPKNPAEGWGMFAKFAIADGNPNILDNTLQVGIAGTALIPSRKLDRFGVGIFSMDFSDALTDALRPLFTLRRERRLEAFYNFAVTRWLHITADIQVLPAAIEGRDTKVFGA